LKNKNYHGITTRVKTAKGRKKSSTRWLQRQLNDPFVVMAQKEGYVSRSAFKLIELDEKFKFLKNGSRIIDLGAAPGGWTQVALEKIGKNGRIIAVDLQDMEKIEPAIFIKGDFLEEETIQKIKKAMPEKATIILSDMSPNTTGDKMVDHLRIINLVEVAFEFAISNLAEGGVFVAKVFQGGAEAELLKKIKKHFKIVKHAKPSSSRPDSKESYLVAIGYLKN